MKFLYAKKGALDKVIISGSRISHEVADVLVHLKSYMLYERKGTHQITRGRNSKVYLADIN